MTEDQAHEILQHLGLDSPLSVVGSYSNAVFVGEQAVVRSNSRPAMRLLDNERFGASRFPRDLRHAKVLGYGIDDQTEWIVNERLEGASLTRKWREFSRYEQRSAIEQLGDQLQKLHSVQLPNWLDGRRWKRGRPRIDFERLGATALASFRSAGVDDPGLERKIVVLATDSHEWSVPQSGAVHCDLHFSNVLIDGLTPTIIDFELLSAGDTGFDLEWLLQYCSWPKRLVSADEEEMVDAGDFEDVPGWLAGAYPDLFLQPNLRERMKLYFAWDLLEQQATAPRGDTWAIEALRDVLADGLPMQLLDSGISAARTTQRTL